MIKRLTAYFTCLFKGHVFDLGLMPLVNYMPTSCMRCGAKFVIWSSKRLARLAKHAAEFGEDAPDIGGGSLRRPRSAQAMTTFACPVDNKHPIRVEYHKHDVTYFCLTCLQHYTRKP